MLRKYRKHIFAISVILLAGVLVWGICSYYSIPRLSKEEKELVRTEYFNQYCGRRTAVYSKNPIMWYDENGYVEEDGVWRYIGTYGDCYAFLRIGVPMGHEEFPGPPTNMNPLIGLTRLVTYSRKAGVYLYHTKSEFGWVRLKLISEITNPDQWITEEQLEQLTQDIEKIAK